MTPNMLILSNRLLYLLLSTAVVLFVLITFLAQPHKDSQTPVIKVPVVNIVDIPTSEYQSVAVNVFDPNGADWQRSSRRVDQPQLAIPATNLTGYIRVNGLGGAFSDRKFIPFGETSRQGELVRVENGKLQFREAGGSLNDVDIRAQIKEDIKGLPITIK